MPHRILVVDDEPQVRKVLVSILHGKFGYLVDEAGSGKDAVDLAMKNNYDLAIIDVRMEGLSGAETYLRLRSIHKDLEAIFFTAVQDFENSHDFLRFSLPSERVLTKPLKDIPKFTQLLISILGPPKP